MIIILLNAKNSFTVERGSLLLFWWTVTGLVVKEFSTDFGELLWSVFIVKLDVSICKIIKSARHIASSWAYFYHLQRFNYPGKEKRNDHFMLKTCN